jgi:histidine ammonia-lyase
MSAAEALKRAGLAPLAPFGADDSALESSNAYFTGLAAMMVYDAREALSWADLTYAIDLNGMNSSISPLALPVQQNRPFKWLNWDAARVLDMMRGSYLFDADDARIIQDPESLRASSIRQGSTWQSWAALRDDLLIQMNSSDHNPAVLVGASPQDSWELATPELRRFYVKGGPLSHGQHGFILSNANWDPYPVANEVEAFTIALANMDVAISQRILRFRDTFFTVIPPLPDLPGSADRYGLTRGSDFDSAALMQDIEGAIDPVPPQGSALVQSVEDLQAQTLLKVARARRVVADTFALLGEDLLTGTYWLDLRKLQDSHRAFGPAPTAVWSAFRRVLPFKPDAALALTRPPASIAAAFIRTHPADTFYGAATKDDH